MTSPTAAPADRTFADPADPAGRARRAVAARRASTRRRKVDPTTTDREYSAPEVEFMTAMHDYKARAGRPFPTWSEVLEVVRALGYRQAATPEAAR